MSPSTAGMYPSLGFDPTPGDEALAQEATATLRDTAAALEQISHVLHGAGSGGEAWRGQAALAFRGLMDEELRPKIDTAWHSFADSLRALEGWAGFVPGAQAVTRRLEREAADLLALITSTRSALGALPPPPPFGAAAMVPAAGQQVADQDAQRSSLTGQVDGLEQQLNELRGQARRHAEDYVQQAESVARRLADAIDAAPNEPGFWSSVGDWFGDALGGLADVATAMGEALVDGLDDLIDNLAPILQTIGDIASMLSTVCGLLAFVPGLQFLGPVSLVLAGVALGTHYLAAAKQTGSFLEPFKNPKIAAQLGMDAAGLVVGLGAAGAATKLRGVAEVAGNTRPVRQLIGGAQEVPWNMFTMAKNGASMNTAEFGWRAAKYHGDMTANVLTTVGIPSVSGTIKGWTRGEFGTVPGTTAGAK